MYKRAPFRKLRKWKNDFAGSQSVLLASCKYTQFIFPLSTSPSSSSSSSKFFFFKFAKKFAERNDTHSLLIRNEVIICGSYWRVAFALSLFHGGLHVTWSLFKMLCRIQIFWTVLKFFFHISAGEEFYVTYPEWH